MHSTRFAGKRPTLFHALPISKTQLECRSTHSTESCWPTQFNNLLQQGSLKEKDEMKEQSRNQIGARIAPSSYFA